MAQTKTKAGKKGSSSKFNLADIKSSKDIPYFKAKISCVCGAEYEAGSTQETIRVDICAACHPFFTGEKRILDSEGRVEKFKKKYKLK